MESWDSHDCLKVMLLRLLVLRVHGDLSFTFPSEEPIGPGEDSYLVAHYRILSIMIDNLTIREFDNFGTEDIWSPTVAIL
jgi:hypothetical protein